MEAHVSTRWCLPIPLVEGTLGSLQNCHQTRDVSGGVLLWLSALAQLSLEVGRQRLEMETRSTLPFVFSTATMPCSDIQNGFTPLLCPGVHAEEDTPCAGQRSWEEAPPGGARRPGQERGLSGQTPSPLLPASLYFHFSDRASNQQHFPGERQVALSEDITQACLGAGRPRRHRLIPLSFHGVCVRVGAGQFRLLPQTPGQAAFENSGE